MNSTPACSHLSASSSLIGREASEIWVSPEQNASKPSPVPAPPTVIFTSGYCWPNASAAAWVIGCTVLEPSTAILPDTFSPPPPWLPLALPQAARTKASAEHVTSTCHHAPFLKLHAPC